MTLEHPVLLFDGVCNLCNTSVQWVLLRDHQAIFRFAPLQEETGKALLHAHGLSPEHIDSVVLVTPERVFTHSDAVLEVLRRLGGWWAVPAALRVVPRSLRDAVYGWVARNRYRWFGRRDACMMPRPEWKARFL
ncbi:MAG: thiol-disulfide oxidoreductase DCC family protein [Saprospiraceae bacterium]|nr:thiol-disulfide oxidoreductase DCC family protein [Saprospiraceae bacterium]